MLIKLSKQINKLFELLDRGTQFRFKSMTPATQKAIVQCTEYWIEELGLLNQSPNLDNAVLFFKRAIDNPEVAREFFTGTGVMGNLKEEHMKDDFWPEDPSTSSNAAPLSVQDIIKKLGVPYEEKFAGLGTQQGTMLNQIRTTLERSGGGGGV